MGVGGYIFNFAGAIVRWTYGTIWRSIARKKKFTFREYLNGPDNSDDLFDLMGHNLVNQAIGFITVLILCFLLVRLG